MGKSLESVVPESITAVPGIVSSGISPVLGLGGE
jgi:hypothetical protein